MLVEAIQFACGFKNRTTPKEKTKIQNLNFIWFNKLILNSHIHRPKAEAAKVITFKSDSTNNQVKVILIQRVKRTNVIKSKVFLRLMKL